MEPPLLLRPRLALAPGCARSGGGARRQRLEHGHEATHGLVVAADHHAVAAIAPPDASADADVDVVKAPLAQLASPPEVVDVVRVTAVDDRVSSREMLRELGHDRVDEARRHHQPDRARRVELLHELLERRSRRVDVGIERLDVVTGRPQPLGHVRPHAAETDHPQLHQLSSRWMRTTRRPRSCSDA